MCVVWDNRERIDKERIQYGKGYIQEPMGYWYIHICRE